MSTQSTKIIDIKQAFVSFFNISDWKKRVGLVALMSVLMLVLLFGCVFLLFVPGFGIFIGLFLLFILGLVGFFIGVIYTGYRQELVSCVAAGKDTSSVRLFTVTPERLKTGLQIWLAKTIYNIPILLIYILGYGLMFAIVWADFESHEPTTIDHGIVTEDVYHYDVEDTSDEPSDTAMLLFYVVMAVVSFVALPLQLITMYIIEPTMFIQYNKYSSFGSMFDIREMWQFFKRNVLNYLVYAGITIALGFALNIAVSIGYISVFILVGLLLLPVIMALAWLVIPYVQSHMIGQIARIDGER